MNKRITIVTKQHLCINGYLDDQAYDKIEEIFEGEAFILIRGEENAVMNSKGEAIVAFAKNTIREYKEHLIVGSDNDREWIILDKKNRIIAKESGCKILLPPRGDMLPMQRDGLWGFINVHTGEKIREEYDAFNHFCKGVSWVRKGNRWGAIDEKGNKITPVKYLYSPDFPICWSDYRILITEREDEPGETTQVLVYKTGAEIIKNPNAKILIQRTSEKNRFDVVKVADNWKENFKNPCLDVTEVKVTVDGDTIVVVSNNKLNDSSKQVDGKFITMFDMKNNLLETNETEK